MNKFHLDSVSLTDAILFSQGFLIAIGISTYLLDGSYKLIFLLSSIISLFPYLYLTFIEKDESILDKWLARSAFTFYQMTLFALVEHLDIILGLSITQY